MTQIIVVRHGEVAGNAHHQPAFVGWSDPPLTDFGQTQAHAVAEFLAHEPLSAVYTSDLQRARITAECIAAPHHLEVRADCDLREVNYGDWEGLSETQILERWPALWPARQNDPWNIAAPAGENYAQMWARFHPHWQQILASHSDETVVLVGHNGLIRMLLCHLLGAPQENFRRIQVNNCGVSRIEVENDKVLVRKVNDTSFLQN